MLTVFQQGIHKVLLLPTNNPDLLHIKYTRMKKNIEQVYATKNKDLIEFSNPKSLHIMR